MRVASPNQPGATGSAAAPLAPGPQGVRDQSPVSPRERVDVGVPVVAVMGEEQSYPLPTGELLSTGFVDTPLPCRPPLSPAARDRTAPDKESPFPPDGWCCGAVLSPDPASSRFWASPVVCGTMGAGQSCVAP